MMRIDYKNAYVQISSFAKEGGVCEYHIMVHAAGDLTFEEQVDALHSAFDAAAADACAGSRPVFMRYFLSDVARRTGDELRVTITIYFANAAPSVSAVLDSE